MEIRTLIVVALAVYAAASPAKFSRSAVPLRHVGTAWGSENSALTNATELKPIPLVRGHERVLGCGNGGSFNRIVGGTEVAPNSFPWQVALWLDNYSFCGGQLISKDWVMTANHCVDGIRQIRVVMGAHNIYATEATQVTMYSSAFYMHPYWNYPNYLNNDIALIRLPTPVTFTNAIQPVCLPRRSDAHLVGGEWVTPTGWGKTSDAGSVSPTLRQVTVPVATYAACVAEYGTALITDDVVCIDSTGVKGVCNGDSGGPLNYYQYDGKYHTRGIASFVSGAGCEGQRPEAYTRVANYLDWIESTTGIIIEN